MNKKLKNKRSDETTPAPAGVVTARIGQAARARLSHIEARSYGDVLVTTPRQGVSIEQLITERREK